MAEQQRVPVACADVRAEPSGDHVRPRVGLLEQAGGDDPNIGLVASSIRSTRRVAPRPLSLFRRGRRSLRLVDFPHRETKSDHGPWVADRWVGGRPLAVRGSGRPNREAV